MHIFVSWLVLQYSIAEPNTHRSVHKIRFVVSESFQLWIPIDCVKSKHYLNCLIRYSIQTGFNTFTINRSKYSTCWAWDKSCKIGFTVHTREQVEICYTICQHMGYTIIFSLLFSSDCLIFSSFLLLDFTPIHLWAIVHKWTWPVAITLLAFY